MQSTLLQPIHIKLVPSILMLGLVSIVSIICCFILLSLPISVAIKVAIISLIFVSSVYFILRDALLILPWSWQIVEVDNKGAFTITNKRGQQFQPTLASSSFIHAACTILNFKRNGFKFTLPPAIIITNAEDADKLRRLRVWLRWFKRDETNSQDDLSAAELEV